jgi:hypothetical protein
MLNFSCATPIVERSSNKELRSLTIRSNDLESTQHRLHMHVLKDLKNNVRNISNYTEKVTFYTYTEYPYYLETTGGKFSPIRRDNVDTMRTIYRTGRRTMLAVISSILL